MSIKSFFNNICTGFAMFNMVNNPFYMGGMFGTGGFDSFFRFGLFGGFSNRNIFFDSGHNNYLNNYYLQNWNNYSGLSCFGNGYNLNNSDFGINSTGFCGSNIGYNSNVNFVGQNFANYDSVNLTLNDTSLSSQPVDSYVSKFSTSAAIQNTSLNVNTGLNTQLNGKYDLAWWKSQGYDEDMGAKLAQDAVTHAKRDPGECVGYTRRTINRLYGTNFAKAPAAYKFGDVILSSPELKGKFKKINVSGLNLKSSDFPDGAIVLWKPGAPGYTKGKAALYGHGAIAKGGKGYANGVVDNLTTCFEVWIPVKT